jgi:tetratricopeptide (TPR) repeat protein
LTSSFDRDLPLWFTRGLAGVVSNTIVRDNFLLDLESDFSAYINSSIYSYRRANLDASVSKERVQSRALSPADVAAGRAALHVAMGRQTEARASIDEARKLDPNNAGSFVAEGLLFDKNGERDQARTAFNKAADLGSPNAYAYYRGAVLKWPAGPQPDQQVLKEMDAALSRATELNRSYGDIPTCPAGRCGNIASRQRARGTRSQRAPAILPARRHRGLHEPCADCGNGVCRRSEARLPRGRDPPNAGERCAEG